jgi:Carboxypeptidase regulatory-like domain
MNRQPVCGIAWVLSVALWFLITPALQGQTVVGRIDGTVTDQGGAVISGAQVVLESLETQATRRATTSDSGTYVIPSVPLGRYTVTITAAGFQSYVQADVRLQVNQSLTIDARLTVGSTSQTVEVQAATLALNQTDATIGSVIEHQEIVDIPLNGRNFTQLILLAPGASPIQTGQQNTFTITGGISPALNGMRAQMNNFTFDGVDNNMRFTNTYAQSPPPDAIEEFKVEQHQTEASAALAAGANINLISRSGSNAFHGSVWEFVRNNAFTANNYFDAPGEHPYHQNQFGFFVGGPLVIPHLIDGRKSKTYFSGYYEGFRSSRNATTFATVPTQAERNGDLSGLLGPQLGTDCVGRPVFQGEIYDPLTTVANAACPDGVIRDPFPNNEIPSDRIGAVPNAYLQYLYPLPNATGPQNLVLSQRTTQNADQFGVRFDQYISEKGRLFARVSRYSDDLLSPGALPANVFEQVNSGLNVAGHYTQIFSPTFILDFLFGYNRATIPFRYKGLGSAFNAAVGPEFVLPLPSETINAQVSLGGSRFSSGTFFDYDLANPDTSYQYNGDLKKVTGKHEITWGLHYMRFRHVTGLQGAKSLGFSPQITGLPSFGLSGDAMAGFYLGYPNSSAVQLANPFNHFSNIYNLFVGDAWKVTPKLTVNVGLQYVYAAPPTVVGNRISLFDYQKALTQPTATDFTFAYLWCTVNPINGAPPKCPGGQLFSHDRNNFAPRFGLAYSPLKETVVRMGYGIFYDYNTNINQNSVNITQSVWPYSVSQAINGQNTTTLGPLNPILSLDNPFPTQAQLPPTPRFTIDRFARDPYAMEWNIGVEHLLPAAVKLSVNYVGAAARKLPIQVTENIAPAGAGSIATRRPLLNSGSFTVDSNEGTSSYNALQVTVEKNVSSSLVFRNSYTYGKSLDIESDANGGLRAPSYAYDTRLSWGPSDFDIPQLNVTSFLYQLPVGRGKKFASNASGLLNAIVGGWELSGILTLRSGTWFSVVDGIDQANTGGNGNQTPLEVADPHSGFSQSKDEWFNVNAFALPPFGSLGNTGSNSLRSAAYRNLDIAAEKSFKIKESLQLQVRVETFNTFNHTNFKAPDSTLTNPLFGQVTAAYPSRDMQGGLKLVW